jgi:hypothetical protein
VQATAEPNQTPAQVVERIAGAYTFVERMHRAERTSGYQVEKLLAAV